MPLTTYTTIDVESVHEDRNGVQRKDAPERDIMMRRPAGPRGLT